MARAKVKKESDSISAFSAFLLRCRQEAGMTQQQLADALGISSVMIAKWERRPHVDPKLSTVRKLAAALGCRMIDLIGEE